jgi:hypothetical protein
MCTQALRTPDTPRDRKPRHNEAEEPLKRAWSAIRARLFVEAMLCMHIADALAYYSLH